ncbi:MAG: hypothetical protein IKD79_01530 [Oscillospiraceae bacterium]|nr:hypothetical protein [Oscillospiraceae bacterium]
MENETTENWPTLAELAPMYRENARLLGERIRLLRSLPPEETAGSGMVRRLQLLEAMRREARELSVLTARYYERGYVRNAKYTV